MSATELKVPFPSERLDALRFFMDKKQQTVEKELQDYLDKTYEKFVPQNVREYVESRIEPEQRQEQTVDSQQASVSGESQAPVLKERQPRPSRRQREQAEAGAPQAPDTQPEQTGSEPEENQGMTMGM
jgi:uncharacterized glyoxalase superfamily metalloenzyme YdcJ